MRVVEVDGVFTEPKEANILYMAVAQRMGILVTTKNDTSANFPMVVSMDEVSLTSRGRQSLHKHLILSKLTQDRICLIQYLQD